MRAEFVEFRMMITLQNFRKYALQKGKEEVSEGKDKGPLTLPSCDPAILQSCNFWVSVGV
jgi:hypothetical protein